MRLVWLFCPECREHKMLGCQVSGTRNDCQVTLVEQVCECDPYGAWEDVWEQAREVVFEEGGYD